MAKKIGGVLYVHRSALDTEGHKLVSKASKLIPNDFAYEVLKINPKANEVSFVASEDWNTSPEPIVGDSYKVNIDTGKVTFRKGRVKNPQIYHHKWMFVNDDYKGFDVEESKLRSELWQNSDIDYDIKKIGNFDYWNEIVLKKLFKNC